MSTSKRLLKRHKREVSRAREHVKISEPDVRTPEEIKAARDASRANVGRSGDGSTNNSTPSFRGSQTPRTGGAAKTDA